MKKMDRTEEGWKCASGHITDTPKNTWNFSCSISDHTGETWVRGLGQRVDCLFPCCVDDFANAYEMKEDLEASHQLELLQKQISLENFAFTIKATISTYNNEERIEYQLFTVSLPDADEEYARLIKAIQNDMQNPLPLSDAEFAETA